METRLTLNDFNVDDIVTSINMRIAFMETGDIALRANDAIKQGRSNLVKPLTDAQRNIIVRMENMVKRILSEQAKQRVLVR